MAGHIYSVKMEFGSKGGWETSNEQVVAARKYQKREEEPVSATEVEHQFFVQSGLSRTKNSGAVKPIIIDEGAIRRWNHVLARCHPPRTATERRHHPNLLGAVGGLVINLLAVGGKAIYRLVALVSGGLKRLPTRSEHQEHLCDAPNRRDKRHSMAVGRRWAPFIGLFHWLICVIFAEPLEVFERGQK